jgi:choline monooxygenase
MSTVIPIVPALTEAESRSLFQPLGEARGLPGRVYGSPDYWAVERDRLFRDDWFTVGAASDVPNAGDVLPVTIAEWELVLVRGQDMKVRCFHNVCRHRGTKLVLAAKNVRTIACGWHCWTYSLEGSLLHTPIIDGPKTVGHELFDRSKLGLVEVRSALWNDTVFVNVGGKARAFEEFVAPIDALFAPYALGDFDFAHPERNVDTELEINWKLYHEGGLEGYHLPFVHPALEQPERYRIDNEPDTFTSLTGTLAKYKRIGAWAGLPDDTLDLNLAAQAAMRSAARVPYTICFVTPTLIFAAWPEAVIVTILRPISASRTAVRRNFYFIGDKAVASQSKAARSKYLDLWQGVTNEDADYSSGVQRLSAQRDEIGVDTRFSPYWEEAVLHFQQRIAQRAYGAKQA